MKTRIPSAVFQQTFSHLRNCGGGKRECQALWVGPWSHPDLVTRVVHPRHSASPVGFQLDDDWLNAFWLELANANEGVRVQVHTHPGAAYHSWVDDEFPIVHSEGFLSLVIPRFATGHVGLDGAFLAQLNGQHRFHEVDINSKLEFLP